MQKTDAWISRRNHKMYSLMIGLWMNGY